MELPVGPVVPRELFQSHPEAEEENAAESIAAEAPSASSPAACVPVPAEQEPAEIHMDQAAAANLQEEPANATLDAQPAEPLPAEEHSLQLFHLVMGKEVGRHNKKQEVVV